MREGETAGPDEAARRRPGIDAAGSVPVRLADGNEWLVPRPRIDLVPVFKDGILADVGRRYSFGEAFYRKQAALADAAGGPAGPYLLAAFDLAIDLLGRNYDLDESDYQALIPYRDSDPASVAMWRAIVAVASGDGPPAGDGPKAGDSGSA